MGVLPEYEKAGRVAPMCVDRVRKLMFLGNVILTPTCFVLLVPRLSGRL